MEDAAAEEKRAIRRFVLELPVTVTASSGEQIQATAKTRDVSSHGICFYCDASMEPESVIEFTLTLPIDVTMTEPISVRCRGKVVRVESKQAGKFAIAAAIESYEFVASDDAQDFHAGAPPAP
jgi:PilZ domain